MTWDQTYDLAKRVTRDDGGIHYKGIDIVWTTYFNYNQLGLSYVDPKTEKATVNTSDWKSLFDPLLKLYTIPGNEFDTKKARDRNIFLKDRNLAMFVNSDIIPLMDEDAQKTLNWDLSTLPVFDKSPKTGSGPFPNNITVTATSKHKDEAFLVVDTLLSDEVQGMRARKYGVYTVLKKQSVKDEYMKDVAYAKGKNTAAFSKLETAPPRNITRYDADANNILGTALEDVLKKKKDINTGLREAEEAVNKKIETVKATDK
jgi:multiple sugar transport system substrate-binding protein